MTAMNWSAIAPEILLLAMACLIALVDLFVTHPKRLPTYLLSLASLVAVGALHVCALMGEPASTVAMQGMVSTDPLGHLLSLAAVIAVGVAWVYGQSYGANRV